MSSSGATPAVETKDVDRRKSLGKYVKRMSSVFRREKSDKGKTKTSPLASASVSAPAQADEKKEAAPAYVTLGENEHAHGC